MVRIVRIKKATCYYNYKLIRGLVCSPEARPVAPLTSRQVWHDRSEPIADDSARNPVQRFAGLDLCAAITGPVSDPAGVRRLRPINSGWSGCQPGRAGTGHLWPHAGSAADSLWRG